MSRIVAWLADGWTAASSWLRQRTPVEGAGLACGLAVFAYLGSDGAIWDPRATFALHLVAIGTILGLAAWAWRGGEVPRTPIEVPLLALLAAFALATASALNHGLSLRAMSSIVAYAAMLPVALIAIRHRPAWVGLAIAVPTLFLAAPGLWVLVERRLDWLAVGAPGLPPIRLPHEGSPFGSVAVPPFVLWPAWAIAGLVEPTWLRRALQWAIAVVAVPYTILSGSRSAWLAIGVVALVVGLPWAWSNRTAVAGFLRRRPSLAWAAGLSAVLTLGLVGILVAERALAATSLVYRVNLWRETLAAWATDVLSGIGPGFMPIARQVAAAEGNFPVRQPHSHNIPLGILGDAGLLGLVAGIALVVVLARVAGPWRSRTWTGRAAAIVLLGLAIGGLSEDISFMPNFSLMAIVLAAIALSDAGAVSWRRVVVPRHLRGPALAAGGAMAAVLAAATITADAGAIAYGRGVSELGRGHRDAAAAWFERSLRLDPWHPTAPKSLAITAALLGEEERARAAAELAVARNPGDGQSWTNLALLCAELGDEGCQRAAIDGAIGAAEFEGVELVNAALLLEQLGRPEEADAAYRRSLLTQRLTSLGVPWPRTVPIGSATQGESAGAIGEMARLLALRASGEPIVPASFAEPAIRALAHAIADDRSAARAALDEAITSKPDELLTWQLAVVLEKHWGEPFERSLRIGEVVLGGGFPPADEVATTPTWSGDLAVFRIVPADGLVGRAERLKTRPPWPWILAEVLP